MSVTENDRQAAADAMVAGWNACQLVNGRDVRQQCDCDLGKIDGCKARLEEIATAIALARHS